MPFQGSDSTRSLTWIVAPLYALTAGMARAYTPPRTTELKRLQLRVRVRGQYSEQHSGYAGRAVGDPVGVCPIVNIVCRGRGSTVPASPNRRQPCQPSGGVLGNAGGRTLQALSLRPEMERSGVAAGVQCSAVTFRKRRSGQPRDSNINCFQSSFVARQPGAHLSARRWRSAHGHVWLELR